MAEAESVESESLKSLLQHQRQISTWLSDVKRRIYETETTYLEETQLGNIIKGWEIDGRPPLVRARGQCEDKERLFSYSSYETWAEQKLPQDIGLGEKKLTVDAAGNVAGLKVPPGPKGRKSKKRKSDVVDEWNQGGDY